jgi:membrane-bound lytic murein transglycosylase MltF
MTANEPYIKIPEISGEKNFDNNVHAGVKYLSWIKKRYFDPKKEMNEESRLRMMMASYNAGPRRVQQAINKAQEMGLDSNKWFRNVELAMLRLGYPEPVIYVSEINKHYVSYVLLGIK